MQATTAGSTANYDYDPLGRLDTVTSGTTVQQSNLYERFDRLTSQTTGGTTTSFSYLGLSTALVTESQNTTVTRSYTYTPADQRLSQTQYSGGAPQATGYYTYNAHSDTEALTGSNGNTTATYGYTAYGQPIPSMFTGADKNNVNPGPAVQPYNAYRYNSMRSGTPATANTTWASAPTTPPSASSCPATTSSLTATQVRHSAPSGALVPVWLAMNSTHTWSLAVVRPRACAR